MESVDKNVYEVKIAGLPVKLKSSHDQNTVDRLVNLVDEKVQEAQERGQKISFQNALLLSALHLAEELILLKQQALQDLDDLESQAQSILSDLEASPISHIQGNN